MDDWSKLEELHERMDAHVREGLGAVEAEEFSDIDNASAYVRKLEEMVGDLWAIVFHEEHSEMVEKAEGYAKHFRKDDDG